MTLYTMDEVASMLQVSKTTVKRWVHSSQLPVVRLGHKTIRIRDEALAEFIESREAYLV